ncbi:hypothetical protein M8C21_029309 [Ambrosia artemisiifolia]|uniref:CPL3 ARM repeat domain-containing protein n=1 Tax=Ambrosia artemisiifolia TaxID=4212 RepID=A0AAD5CDF2_AMBAR|nr:hypothetical protein M8C21_029309 [Ambrosia artemisiifolia]
MDATYIKGQVGFYTGFYVSVAVVTFSGIADALVRVGLLVPPCRICFLMLLSCDVSLSTLVKENYVLNKEDLVHLAFAAIQLVNSVYLQQESEVRFSPTAVVGTITTLFGSIYQYEAYSFFQ